MQETHDAAGKDFASDDADGGEGFVAQGMITATRRVSEGISN
ncbi:hypothetical protein SH528x_001619 [Novipirellula sp. SH528]